MEITADDIVQKYAKKCGHCKRNTLLPYEYAFTCITFGYNMNKRKHEFSKIQRKRINFSIRLKYAERNLLYLCRCI